MSYVTIQSVPCSAGALTLQLGGCWLLQAELSLDAMAANDGDPVDATFGDLALRGTVFRGGNFTGEGQLLVRGGFGGWSKPVRPKYYHSSFGLRSADIVQDAAREVGEVMATPAPGTSGTRFVRLGSDRYLACKVLQLLAPSWWVDFDGRTWPTVRPSGIMTEPLNVISDETSLSDGRVLCAPDLLAGILPGMTFSTPTIADRVATSVVHRVVADRVRTELWTR